MKVKITELKKLASQALARFGYTEAEAAVISEVLFYAQLRDNNQGIVKLIGSGLPKSPEAGEITIIKETKLSALLDGKQNQGMLVMKKGLEMALAKASEHGFGLVGNNNTHTSTGAIGFYAREIAQKGFIGFVFAGSPETVNAHGSYEPIFGTNPLAIGVPSAGEPVVLDMATASMAFFGLIEAKTAGRPIPEGIAYDKDGSLTTDPAQAIDGAIRPFDQSYKGAGLAMMVEVLTGPLVAASFTGIGDTAKNWGNLIMVIDPELLADQELFKKQVSLMVEKVKGTKKLPGVTEILVPGERGNQIAKANLASGEIEVEDHLYQELVKATQK
jgi:L-2-hydroxycarboxylate dehydrogenase (NAD+)